MSFVLQKDLFEKHMLVDRYVEISNDNAAPEIYVVKKD